jgi:DNA-binding NtrC family response regulator
LTDLKLPNGDGFGVLRAAKELDPELQVVVMTAFGSIQDAVAAMKQGAMDFLAKPVDPDHLVLMVERAIAQRRMLGEYILLKEELAQRRGAPRIIGEDPQLRQVSQQLHRAADTDATVLLEGESGTGKELFARALHVLSPRADGPFVAINCAAIPDTLLETELFGHEKGAFTGAVGRKPGRFEMARPPTASSRRGLRRGSSGRISTSGCRSFPSRSRRCAIGGRTSRPWRATLSRSSAAI